MKQHTHPGYSFTLIRQKDGSSYNKQWVYNRSMLILEGDQKIWDSVQMSKTYKTFFLNIDQKKSEYIGDKFKSNGSFFWFKKLFDVTNGNFFSTIILFNKQYSIN